MKFIDQIYRASDNKRKIESIEFLEEWIGRYDWFWRRWYTWGNWFWCKWSSRDRFWWFEWHSNRSCCWWSWFVVLLLSLFPSLLINFPQNFAYFFCRLQWFQEYPLYIIVMLCLWSALWTSAWEEICCLFKFIDFLVTVAEFVYSHFRC